MRIIGGAIAASLLAGCATQHSGGYGSNWEPVVDVRAGQYAVFRQDLAECQVYATKVIDAQQAAVAGAVAGALFGALLGAAAGGGSRFNGRMAGVGALTTGVGAAGSAEMNQRAIISRCLMGRGYSVLN